MTTTKVVFCWSGGKDSALALNRLRQDSRYEVIALLTTCNEHFQRVSMHGVRLELLEAQARAIGLPLEKVFVSRVSTNEEYERKMTAALRRLQERGAASCAFGDIFLEDLRRWREANLSKIGMEGLFPIWKIDSRALLEDFFAQGFQSVTCCVNDAWLGPDAVGRNIDLDFVRSLPSDVDPCGENGEFHSFAFAGPIFPAPIAFKLGQKVYRPLEDLHPGSAPSPHPSGRVTKGFWFCDLLPG